MPWDDVAHDENAVFAQEPAKRREQRIECIGREVLRHRMQHDGIERARRHRSDGFEPHSAICDQIRAVNGQY